MIAEEANQELTEIKIRRMSDEQHYFAWQTLADKLCIPFDREANNRFRGVSRMECMDILADIGKQSFTDEEKAAYATMKSSF